MDLKIKVMIIAYLPDWTDCVVEVADMGRHSFWGIIVDRKNNSIARSDAKIFDLNDDWIFEPIPAIIFSTQN